jgi:hypothetical protein
MTNGFEQYLDQRVELIVAALQQDRVLDRADRSRKGIDLTDKKVSLKKLLVEVLETYAAEREDWETRHDDPNKPKKRLEANWDRHEEPAYDYGGDTGAGLPPWAEHYEMYYATGPGNPGRSRTASPLLPIPPLHTAYRIVRHWWLAEVNEHFNPDLPREHEADKRQNPQRFNAAGRLFYMVADTIDPRYTPTICYGVHETVRKQLQKERRGRTEAASKE